MVVLFHESEGFDEEQEEHEETVDGYQNNVNRAYQGGGYKEYTI